jgi:transglutaminase-like putative cysteine protease
MLNPLLLRRSEMKKNSLILVGLVLLCCSAYPGEILYKVSDIPAELKENARSVIRFSSHELVVTDIRSATLKITTAITVLNKNGLEDANLILYYDKYETVSSLRGRTYDENGELIRKIPGEDIDDYSAIGGYSLYEDNRVKYIDPEIRQYPFTVEYSYELNFKGILYFPSWFPVNDYNVSVEKSVCKILMAKGMELKYRESNLPVNVSVSSDESSNIYHWELTNYKALKQEALGPDPRDRFPMVMLAPLDFEIAGYKGNSGSWSDFGDWVYSLNAGRDILLPETVTELNGLVKNCKDEKEKICCIYEYMQGRVRYVNLSIGIGGWQPIDASTVQRLGYGDCKALSNYMKAMLKAIGIHSYYCLVFAGRSAPELITSFPSSQFNHAILCVPLGQDTLWLECTSQQIPCGYLGGFTENRYALLVDKSNSRLVRTNERQPVESFEKCSAIVTFDETGTGSINMKTCYSGLSYDEIISTYLADDLDKKKKISERMLFPSFGIDNYSYTETRSADPLIEETLNINFENYITAINSRFLMPLNCTNRVKNSPSNSRNRKADVVIRHGSLEIDSLVYIIPPYLKIESCPENVEISSPFGTYKSVITMTENNLIYFRRLQITKGVHPADAYPGLIEFFDRITVADDEKCVFVRNE